MNVKESNAYRWTAEPLRRNSRNAPEAQEQSDFGGNGGIQTTELMKVSYYSTAFPFPGPSMFNINLYLFSLISKINGIIKYK